MDKPDWPILSPQTAQLVAAKKRRVLERKTLAKSVVFCGRLPLPGMNVCFYIAWWSSCVFVSIRYQSGSDEKPNFTSGKVACEDHLSSAIVDARLTFIEALIRRNISLQSPLTLAERGKPR